MNIEEMLDATAKRLAANHMQAFSIEDIRMGAMFAKGYIRPAAFEMLHLMIGAGHPLKDSLAEISMSLTASADSMRGDRDKIDALTSKGPMHLRIKFHAIIEMLYTGIQSAVKDAKKFDVPKERLRRVLPAALDLAGAMFTELNSSEYQEVLTGMMG